MFVHERALRGVLRLHLQENDLLLLFMGIRCYEPGSETAVPLLSLHPNHAHERRARLPCSPAALLRRMTARLPIK